MSYVFYVAQIVSVCPCNGSCFAAGLSRQSSRFYLWPFHVSFMEADLVLGQAFFPNTSVFPCRCNSKNAASPLTLVYLISRPVTYCVLNIGYFIGNRYTNNSVPYILT
jgi:hypothetical protein